MICPNCNAQLPDGTAFCVNCGSQLVASAVQPGSQLAAPAVQPGWQQEQPGAYQGQPGAYQGQPGAYQGQPSAYQQGAYQQPSYYQSQAAPTAFPQSATSRAFAMVMYMAGIIGLIIALCVRDKDDPFITHHLNNVVVIFIGTIIGSLLSIVLIGFILLIYLLVMAIMGMVSAYHGDMNELPLIGKIHIVK